MGMTRRTVLKAGAAAMATAATPGIFAQQPTRTGAGKFYERSPVRIYYEETGSGFPLLLIPGGGLNSTIAALANREPRLKLLMPLLTTPAPPVVHDRT